MRDELGRFIKQPEVHRNCIHCGKEYIITGPKRVARIKASKFCSTKCMYAHPKSEEFKIKIRNSMLGRKNHFFGKKHTLKTRLIIKEKRKLQVGENHPNWKGGPQIIICQYCKKEFIVPYNRRYAAKFCSLICEWRNRDKGKTSLHIKIRESFYYDDWRLKVFKRDNYTCQDCGQIGGYLHSDHIKSFANYPELRFDINNGRTLCIACHFFRTFNKIMPKNSKWGLTKKLEITW